MITIEVNDYDYANHCPRNPVLWDVLVDKTRVHTTRSHRQAVAFIKATQQDLGFACARGTQMQCFTRYYREKYQQKDLKSSIQPY